jgi:hypothetical protein
MMKPKRIQRKRTKGWRMPPNTVIVTRPGRFGNHPAARLKLDGQMAVDAFRCWVDTQAFDAWKEDARRTLRGKNLACWCPIDQPCHADVLLELANQ